MILEMDKDSEISGGKLDTRFKKGFDPKRNLKGKPVGKLSYITEMDNAIDEYAKLHNLTSAQVRLDIYMKGAEEALKGEYSFYRDYMDRKHGKPIQPITGEDGGPIQIQGVEISIQK